MEILKDIGLFILACSLIAIVLKIMHTKKETEELYIITDASGRTEDGIQIASNIGKKVIKKRNYRRLFGYKAYWKLYLKIYKMNNIEVDFNKRLFLVRGIPLDKYGSSNFLYSKKIHVVRELEWKELLGPRQNVLTENFLKVLENASLENLNEYVDSYLALSNGMGISKDFQEIFNKEEVVLKDLDSLRGVDLSSECINSIFYAPFANQTLKQVKYLLNENEEIKSTGKKLNLDLETYSCFRTTILAILASENLTERQFSILMAPWETTFGKFDSEYLPKRI